ncbi:hypothetical protein QQ045_014218 [Rhodiola kirilowii]
MARASFSAVSVRLIRSMHVCRPALRQTSIAHVLDRYGGRSSCSWCPVSDVEKMMMIAITFPRQHLFGTVSSPNYPVSVPVEDAYKLHKAGHKYLDVRTRQEFDEGHVSGAVNIPYLLSNEGSMSKNPKFLEVASKFGGDDKIIVGCRSGKRSLMAVEDLRSAGYSKATNIEGGYLAWPSKE